MKGTFRVRFVLVASVVASLMAWPAAGALAGPAGPAGSAAAGKVSVRHWIGTWSGKLSERPQPPPGDPQNPYKVVATIRSVSKRTIGSVKYPAWKCSYKLVKKSASAGKLSFLMKLVHQGPFNCVSQETVVLRSKAKGASFQGTFAGGIESGSVRKA